MIKFVSDSPEKTMEFAGELISKLNSGAVIALNGELGAGKTVFVKGAASFLGITDYITSPTFNIVKQYSGMLELYHFDVYRLADVDELFEIGFEEYIYGEGICIIEWAELIEEALPADTITVTIKGSGAENRVITVEGGSF